MPTPTERRRPPYVADERTQLVGWLDLQREIVRWKCEGLSDAHAHRVVLPTSPLMTVAGIVSHLRWTENTWFEVAFLDRPEDGPQFDEPDDGSDEDLDNDMRVDGVPLAQLLDDYERQCALSNEIIAAHSLDDVGRHEAWPSGTASLRWMLHHMLEETARHAGHLDIVRELLDGGRGYY
ncbi:DinB family protein [Intrasporangium sp. YIM S08009]|uniref:DinB family protein n=1 Tax=Intrasporangium zincisolvens TaxID=3080018 RepID=UPI002B051967|nr:DinB family protein [Intrasporangium sp. YIM S08009]